MKTTADIQGGSYKLKIATAGPGIFLVGLGVWLLVGVANHPLEMLEESPAKKSSSGLQEDGRSLSKRYFQNAVDSAALGQKNASCEPCLLKRVIRKLDIGDITLRPEDIETISASAANAIARSGVNGIADEEERVRVIVGLRNLAYVANKSR